tara:strand:+ start:275 stop:1324 length:1050 start_codon:yes stop_codon:yes gene_type:complete
MLKKIKISILLPYKENFSPNYAGAVSLFLNDTINLSKYKNNITVYGQTDYKKKLSKNYVNINFSKFFFKSNSKSYLKKFLYYEKLKRSNIIEIHNRPSYLDDVYKVNKNIILYYHNDPLSMKASIKLEDRLNIIDKTKKIIFNSNWTLNQFKKGIPKNINKNKLQVIHQSTKKKRINFKKKKNIILFVGRLNRSKGFDIFGESIIKVLDKFPKWKSVVIGDEPRENFDFSHRNLKFLGFKKNHIVTKWFSKSNISVVCSMINEPFGRTALEASSCGCAVIITNRGGLPEASPKAIRIQNLTAKNLESSITKLIINKKLLLKLQKNIYNNFTLTNENASKKIDLCREKLI